MRVEDYLITSLSKPFQQKRVWHSDEPFEVDHPFGWILERRKEGIEAKYLPTRRAARPLKRVLIPTALLYSGQPIKLPQVGSESSVELRIRRLRASTPAFMPTRDPNGTRVGQGPHAFFLFAGLKDYLYGYQRVSGTCYVSVANSPVFAYLRDAKGLQVKALRTGLRVELPEGATKNLERGKRLRITEAELSQSTLRWRDHWWRVTLIPSPADFPPETFHTHQVKLAQENKWFVKFSQTLFGSCVLFSLLFYAHSKYQEAHRPRVVAKTQVTLKEPKWVAPLDIPVSPPPEPKIEKPKAIPSLPVAKKMTPKPQAQPPPPPPKLGRREGGLKQPGLMPSQQAARETAQREARAEEALSKSLGFLSPSQNRIAQPIPETASTFRTTNPVSKSLTRKDESLTGSSAADPVDTQSARSFAPKGDPSGVVGGKGLNKVQGKVTLNQVFGNGTGNLVGEGGQEMSLSGEGEISKDQVEKALERALSRFQYCYEKSLLSQPNLAGTLVMEWVISANGKAQSVKVVRSELNQASLHLCVAKEIGQVDFPKPKGGSVTIQYPFAFSSGAL